MSYGRAWTYEEDQQLKSRWCAGVTLHKVARELGRSRSVARNRLRVLGLFDSRERVNVRWTPEADARLTALWFDMTVTTAQIGNRIGTTAAGVKHRASVLDLPNRTGLIIASRQVREPKLAPEPVIDFGERHAEVCRAAGGFTAFSETWAGRGGVPQSLSMSKDWKLGPIVTAMRRAA